MAVIKIFDCNGVKTVEMLGNANEQDYDPVTDDDEINQNCEDTDDGF